jgi:hypothetical protein
MLKGPAVSPTPRDHPGYDAVLIMTGSASLLISFKRFGKSAHQRGFEKPLIVSFAAHLARLAYPDWVCSVLRPASLKQEIAGKNFGHAALAFSVPFILARFSPALSFVSS